MIRIGIDGRAFQGHLAGTGRYVHQLCLAIDELMPDAHFFVYSNQSISLPVRNARWRQVGDRSSWGSRQLGAMWYLERVATMVNKDAIDVFWGCANLLPRGLKSAKTVLTVMDLVAQLYPQTMGMKHRLAYKLYFDQSLRQADRLVTISEGSKTRLEELFCRSADEIVFPCSSSQFKPPSASDIQRVKALYALGNPFLLAVATLEPRKNLDALLTALIELKIEGRTPVADLVLVGQIGWKASSLLRLIRRAELAGIRVIQTGFVSDADLPALYGASKAFVFPSLYEGFGMPVLEAVKCGARVFASDVPEIREAGGVHATYFEPSVQGIKQALEPFLSQDRLDHVNSDQICDVRDHGSTWETEAVKMASVFRSLL